MKELMRVLKESRWSYILFSIVLATIFWLFVRQTEDPVRTGTIRNIPVSVDGEQMLEAQGLTVRSVSHDTVSLRVSAPLSQFERMQDNMTIPLDVSRCSAPGEYQLSYRLNYPSNVVVSDVTVNERLPLEITVVVEQLASKSFTIEPRLEGSIAAGYQAGSWSISQETVLISGAADQVSQVDRVEAVLQGSDLTDRVSGDVPLTLLDKDGNELQDLDVTLSTDTVYITLPVVVVKTVPLRVSFTSGGGVDADDHDVYGHIIFPETITISGEKSDMEELTEIFVGNVNLAKVVGVSTFTFPIDLDPRLENVSGTTQATVTVTVSNLDTKSLSVTNIDIEPPAGRTAGAGTQECPVVLRGRREALDQVDASQIRIVADLTEITSTGQCTVPVRVYLNASKDVGVIGEYRIVVDIT